MEKMTMTVKEVAAQLNVSLPTAYELTRQKGFPVLAIGRRVVVPVTGLQEWLNNNTKDRR